MRLLGGDGGDVATRRGGGRGAGRGPRGARPEGGGAGSAAGACVLQVEHGRPGRRDKVVRHRLRRARGHLRGDAELGGAALLKAAEGGHERHGRRGRRYGQANGTPGSKSRRRCHLLDGSTGPRRFRRSNLCLRKKSRHSRPESSKSGWRRSIRRYSPRCDRVPGPGNSTRSKKAKDPWFDQGLKGRLSQFPH